MRQSVPNPPAADGLYLMDGVEGLLALPEHSVDMLLTDPPYGSTRNYWDVPLPLPELWTAVRWALKPDGAALFFVQCPYDKVLGASNLSMLRYEWIWVKARSTGFLNANRAPLKKTENILVFYQKSPAYFPQFTYGEPYQRIHPRSGSTPNYGKFERQSSESADGRRYPSNVLTFPTVARLWERRSLLTKSKSTKQRPAKAKPAKGGTLSAQQTIPYVRMLKDGVCQLPGGLFSKTPAYEDINYSVASTEDQSAIFNGWRAFSTILTVPSLTVPSRSSSLLSTAVPIPAGGTRSTYPGP